MPDHRWRHPWQVFRFSRNGAVNVACSHRSEFTAGWCAEWRDFLAGFNPRATTYHSVRRNTYVADTGAVRADQCCRGRGLASRCEHGVGLLDECKACTAEKQARGRGVRS
jgi:hypothetical protein